ncbi:MAG: hypothetical protein V9F00_17595 [Nocardioides sp.]
MPESASTIARTSVAPVTSHEQRSERFRVALARLQIASEISLEALEELPVVR